MPLSRMKVKGRYRICKNDEVIPDERLAKLNPSSKVIDWGDGELVNLGDTKEYQRAFANKLDKPAKTPARSKKGSRKASQKSNALVSWMGSGGPNERAGKARKKAADEEAAPDGLDKFLNLWGKDETGKAGASEVSESSKPQETSNEQTIPREGYEVVSHIQEIARKKGIENAYQLWLKIGGSKESAAQLWRGDFKKVGVSTLKKLCETLGCGVGDLLVFEPSTASRTS